MEEPKSPGEGGPPPCPSIFLRAKELFLAALEMPDEERMPYVLAQAGENERLVQMVSRLLDGHQGGKSKTAFLELPDEIPQAQEDQKEKQGDRIGNQFTLLEPLGEGAFGIVWRALQDPPLKREVAIKFLRLDAEPHIIGRFDQEREALARMEHRNVARVISIGLSDAGQAYLVMDLVRGAPITKHCDNQNLSTEERIRLFLQVCSGLQHAHQKGIIHRDVKPSNVLVTWEGGVAIVKIIDFGVAKIAAGQSLDLTFVSQIGGVMGTVAYMSPELAEAGVQGIDAQSDVYALGVLLCEILTGRLPYEGAELLKYGQYQVHRVIRESEPPKPSTLVSSMSGEQRDKVAHQRKTAPPKLAKLLQGDLDWIVLKALNNSREHRYATPAALAEDLERYLKREPVVAHPPNASYRLRCFVLRNKSLCAAGASVVLMLFVGLVMALVLLKRTAAEEAKSAEVATFLKTMLQDLDPSTARGQDPTMLKELLDRTALRLGPELKHQPAVEAELRDVLGAAYLKLGNYGAAESMHRKALELQEQLHGAESLAVADASDHLAVDLRVQSKFAEAERLNARALAAYRHLLGEQNLSYGNAIQELALIQKGQGMFEEAEKNLQKALSIQEKCSGPDDPHRAVLLENLGVVLAHQDKLHDSEKLVREALAIFIKREGEWSGNVLSTLSNLADVLQFQCRYGEAQAIQAKILEWCRQAYPKNHPQIGKACQNLAVVMQELGKHAEAEQFFLEALEIYRSNAPYEQEALARAITGLAVSCQARGDLAHAEELFHQAFTLCGENAKSSVRTILFAQRRLIDILLAEKKLTQAEAFAAQQQQTWRNDHSVRGSQILLQTDRELVRLNGLSSRESQSPEWERKLAEQRSVMEGLYEARLALLRQNLEKARQSHGMDSPGTAEAWEKICNEYLDVRLYEDAESAMTQALGIRQKQHPGNLDLFRDQLMLGEIFVNEGRLEEAERLLKAGYESMLELRGQFSTQEIQTAADAVRRIVAAYDFSDQGDETSEWKRHLAAFFAQSPAIPVANGGQETRTR